MTSTRVVSLIPSATEIVCALGSRDRLVGRSHECDYPDGVAALPPLTASKLALDGTSYEIDARVKAVVQEGLSVYRVDGALLKRLAPDLIVTQTQCEVCAASLEDVEAALRDWTERPAEIVSLAPNRLADIWEDIRRVAQALGLAARGEALVAALRQRMEAVTEMVAGLDTRPRVACIEWIDPPMAAGNWVPEMVAMAGGENLFGEAGAHSPWLDWEELRASDPDAIVVFPCGFDLARTRAEMPALVRRRGWRNLAAVRAGRVYLADGNRYFNRPGPRLAESLEILAEILHPADFRFGHEGDGWVRAG